ncbi:MAG: phosphoribosylformylglycinamidine synthase subunit PurQ [Chitinophagales bacterium]|nr:phosphoribosylformylglycinamidine synthase subunit PurQ [Chitinophagales bacterium]MDW8273801.1 phosphoribosylformylglycinamidine synthase subunit PurQ [Chitinophagales bacterium]
MKFGVIVFPGSNCDRDMLHVLGNVLGAEVREIFHKERNLDNFETKDCIVLPGGFSYGDYLRTGAIARFSPIMGPVIEFAKSGGKVLGICNGFQILCESKLLPGVLLRNNNMQYICKNVWLKVENNQTALTAGCSPGQILQIPIAHGDGRYYCDAETLRSLQENHQILFTYCDKQGNVNEQSNPNGSLNNIAGICNEKRNVFGMMPHPERATEPAMGNTDGRILLESLIHSVSQPV